MKYKNPVVQYAYNEAQAFDLSRLSARERNNLVRYAIKSILLDRTVLERDPETRKRMIDDLIKAFPRYLPKF